jgi:hypothetical protein
VKILLAALRLVGIRTHRAFRLFIRLFALLIGLFAAFQVALLIQKANSEHAEYWHLVVIAAAVIEFVLADVLAERSFPFDTERKLALMERRLGTNAIEAIVRILDDSISEFRGCNKSLVSATVHLLVEIAPSVDTRMRQGLLQLTDYVGPEGGKKGRLTLITQGVIGRCARTGEIEHVGFADEAEYSAAMVREFGFSRREAERHSKTGRSYLAIPLKRENVVVGVLYFFSSEPQVFPRSTNSGDLQKSANFISSIVNVVGLI